MEKIITKTNETVTSTLKGFGQITFDFSINKIIMSMSFDEKTFTGYCTFAQSLNGATDSQKNIIKAFFRRAKRICLNNGVNPDTLIVDGDITEDLE